jgi:hypothetical protein
VTASLILRQLASYPRQNRVAAALRELGRLERTLATLNWLEDPELRRGASLHHFRGLLRLYSRYGLLDCSTAQGGLCHEASVQPVTRRNRSSATRSYRQLPGWILPTLVNRAFGAH